MKFETFEKIIHLIKENDKWVSACYELQIDLNNSPLLSRDAAIIKYFFEEIYGKEGFDWIEWWLYENVEKKIYTRGKTSVEIDLTEVKNLWKYLEKTYIKKEKRK